MRFSRGRTGRGRSATVPPRRQRRLLTVVAMSTAGLVAVAACGSGGSSTASSPTGSTGANAATGSPVVIGFINQTTGQQAAYPEMTVAAQAAIKYVNAELGGAGGHRVDMHVCNTDGTPTQTQSCAQKLAAEKPLLVVAGSDFNWALATKIFNGANIPVFGQTPVQGPDYTAKDTYYLSNGSLGAGAAQAAYVIKNAPDAKKVGIIGPQIPALQSIITLITKALEAKGKSVKPVTFPPTTTDFLSAWSALGAKDLDYVIAELPTPFCVPLINASKSQNNTTPVITTALCNSATTFSKVGDAMDGWAMNGTGPDPYGNTPDAVLYRAKMAQYAGKSANLGGYAPFGFQVLMWVTQSIMKPVASGLTADAVRAQALKPGGHVFLGPDSYQCASNEKYTSVCSWDVYMTKVKGRAIDSTPGSAEYIDALETLKSTGV
ncbi:putative Branched-chain amino acid transport system substrate-binding protein [Frankia canadensis]|uniref:Putative Branched-chain amino acid transport system substrate-binding protein n=1 Tax=Frankia canadensis TaxID=1836972 RepID=A0A2I2KQE6_9ACTN|nr:ABC transporter substrate-binding protein [Frankia canadensis]SNQ47891.1 putative Branched-chain amino acid transport system substrate-binding protein [Frankia canadensis]SOU55181.1 putative Branched-chain amino acid transport system substrate-binding protein [Frankia canadensis]